MKAKPRKRACAKAYRIYSLVEIRNRGLKATYPKCRTECHLISAKFCCQQD